MVPNDGEGEAGGGGSTSRAPQKAQNLAPLTSTRSPQAVQKLGAVGAAAVAPAMGEAALTDGGMLTITGPRGDASSECGGGGTTTDSPCMD